MQVASIKPAITAPKTPLQFRRKKRNGEWTEWFDTFSLGHFGRHGSMEAYREFLESKGFETRVVGQ